MLASFSVSFQKPQFQAAIVAVLTCAFDASSIIFPIFYWLHSTYGFSRRSIFVAYAWICGTLYLGLSALHAFAPSQPGEQEEIELDADEGKLVAAGEEELPLNQRSFEEQLRSFEFGVICAFVACHGLRADLYICTQDQLLPD